jgi:hypothetical protein
MFICLICVEIVDEFLDLLGLQLALVLRKHKHLMSCRFDGAGLVNVDMSALSSDDTFVTGEKGIDDGRIGLGAAYEEIYVSIRAAAGETDFVLRCSGERVVTISRGRDLVGLYKFLKDLRMGAFHIIAV